MGKLNVLLADDDAAICTVLTHALTRAGYDVSQTDNVHTLMQWVEDGRGDLVITDVVMPSGNGLEMLPHIKQTRPDLPVIVISAQNTLMTAVKANALGAFDYLPKPFDLNELLACVHKSVEVRQAQAGNDNRDVTSASLPDHQALIGSSPAIQDMYKVMARLVGNDLTVLIEGESGTGKELVARALHQLGKRSHKPFVAMNMAAIPQELVESELFGHEKGAFTGALTRKTGRFAQAEGGTLFLDEIGDMPAAIQTSLLRVLQQGEYTPVGASQPIKTNLRIICATHRNLAEMVRRGEFREDLYYRLNVVPLQVPPLRERADDLGALAEHFLRKAEAKGLPLKQLGDDALASLKTYAWPGNVRELENLMYRLAALSAEPTIGLDTLQTARQMQQPQQAASADLQSQLRAHLKTYFATHQPNLPPDGLYERMMELVELPLLEESLRATRYNQLRAARLLGINRNTLRKKMQQLGLMDRRPS